MAVKSIIIWLDLLLYATIWLEWCQIFGFGSKIGRLGLRGDSITQACSKLCLAFGYIVVIQKGTATHDRTWRLLKRSTRVLQAQNSNLLLLLRLANALFPLPLLFLCALKVVSIDVRRK